MTVGLTLGTRTGIHHKLYITICDYDYRPNPRYKDGEIPTIEDDEMFNEDDPDRN